MTAGIWITELEPPHEGPRLAVKDLFDTAGLVTTYGSAIFAEHVPEQTAEAVTRLETAGYATVGKKNLHEFAYGVTSENPHYGTVTNPLAPGRIAGGSSGGSAAALAAGLADAALGSDSGGSIRIPAACCGVVGFKPSYGLVPLDGCFPLAASFDHAGPMARTVAECATMLTALAPAFESSALESLADLHVAVGWLDDAAPLVRERVAAAARLFPNAAPVAFPRDTVTTPLFMREVAAVHAELFAENRELYGADVARKLDRCLEVRDGEAAAAADARDRLREDAHAALEGLDLLLTPTLPVVAPPSRGLEDDERRRTLIRFTYTFNALGWPALALPCGAAEEGLPASVQLVGRPGADALVLAAGALLERELSRPGD